ncbi:YajQ family cyclic di-GMP-binding protein [Vibrio sp. UCD-FRSSP16_10]|uniref:YajQ family cyclic di-GMP-binding protein n=1 Tax=unclassified Vibrio TaxID=2614977 RepID=UPI0007FD40EA|nr:MULTISPECIES: YajQ family cyclic di-GMP-binding protein [unclassified Vibrio]OBT12214.1 YajQ family cyclic di-GMP-binding protein [Vibrio sp. UCD-FRSSP16_30]OBT20545.1 YajQ family cyclic di-GMP-binding protein [Vibrio sp. UCD-FRSSP16_10]
MPSFDVVSEVEMVDIRHAVENANREIATRFDFRGVQASFEFKDDSVKLIAEAEFQLKQMRDILRGNLTKRSVDVNTMDAQKEEASGKNRYQTVLFRQGIDKEMAKKLVKTLKDAKLKVQASIQGEKVRITGKKRDDLQAAIAFIKGSDLGQPFQYENFRD